MVRKADTVVPVKVRMREDLRRRIEKIAKRNAQSVNNQTVLLLEAAVLAEEMGLGGVEGVVMAARGDASKKAFEEITRWLDNKGAK